MLWCCKITVTLQTGITGSIAVYIKHSLTESERLDRCFRNRIHMRCKNGLKQRFVSNYSKPWTSHSGLIRTQPVSYALATDSTVIHFFFKDRNKPDLSHMKINFEAVQLSSLFSGYFPPSIFCSKLHPPLFLCALMMHLGKRGKRERPLTSFFVIHM